MSGYAKRILGGKPKRKSHLERYSFGQILANLKYLGAERFQSNYVYRELIQIKVSDDKYHLIDIRDNGILFLKLYGDDNFYEMGSLKEVETRIIGYFHDSVRSENIGTIKILDKLIDERIHVDCSVKSHRSTIAVVKIQGKELTIHFKESDNKKVNDAELEAIIWARSLYPNIPIFSDSKTAVDLCRKLNIKDVNWISRKFNKIADIFTKLKGIS